jgi:SRSO17 transposase
MQGEIDSMNVGCCDINFEAKRQRGFKLPILGQELKEKKKTKL